MIPKQYRATLILALALLALVSGFLALSIGSIAIAPSELLSICLGPLASLLGLAEPDPAHSSIILYLRLPRILLALLAGSGLALAGATLQGLFRNPLADPALIGVSSGGAVGAGLVLLLGSSFSAAPAFGSSPYSLMLMAMLGSIGSTYLVYRLSKTGGRIHVPTMLLCGIAVNTFGGALVGVMLFCADLDTLREITFCSMGSFSRAPHTAVFAATPIFLLLLLLLLRQSKPLNVLLLGNAEALHLGFDPHPIQRHLILLSGALVGLSVALCGTIAFVGLVTPHLVRLLVGPNHRYLLPGSALVGSVLMVLVDLLAHNLLAQANIPIGILTAFIGAPFFLYLLFSARRKEIV
ncbi:MAG: iron chelate uptake ABC transporter family permease subunit [Verrucomicrobia bacterium]|nr:iron chelate uptake ABC transporter family permease subunit [Verrucomicrobiota bacterium]